MKQLFYILTFLFIGNHLYAQSIIPPISSFSQWAIMSIDSGTVRISYALNAVDIKDTKTYDDLQRLDIGSKSSKYYSYYIFNNDSLRKDFGKKRTEDIPITPGEFGKKGYTWSLLIWSDYFKDFTKNTLTEYALMPRGVYSCQYTEEMPVQEWELHEDTLAICGYLCQKATCRFRGRNFVAWFAPELSISNGPWKFGGLPGLILKVYDTDELYIFECIKIESLKNKFPITLYDGPFFRKIERIKLRNLDKEIYNDYHKFIQVTNSDGVPEKFTPIPYHPLELE